MGNTKQKTMPPNPHNHPPKVGSIWVKGNIDDRYVEFNPGDLVEVVVVERHADQLSEYWRFWVEAISLDEKNTRIAYGWTSRFKDAFSLVEDAD